jgi:hypothetical protein
MLRSFQIRAADDFITLKPKNDQVSISVALEYFKVELDERQIRQILALMFPDTVWPHYAPHLLIVPKKPSKPLQQVLWKKNSSPPANAHWAIPIFSFLGALIYQSNGDLQVDPALSTLSKSWEMPKPFVTGTSVWYYGKLKKNGFRIQVRLKKGSLLSHISLPLENPNPQALAIIQALWGKKEALERFFEHTSIG